jgi:ABC-type iron transport system FetAB ATPase subunit
LYDIIQQKLVVGDDSGTLACYEFKKGEPVVRIILAGRMILAALTICLLIPLESGRIFFEGVSDTNISCDYWRSGRKE